MPSAIKQATLAIIHSYEADFAYGARAEDPVESSAFYMNSGQAWSAERKMPASRKFEIWPICEWIEDETVDDVAFQKLLSNHVSNVMESGLSVFGFFNVDVWPDKLMVGLRKILATPAFQADNLRLVRDAKKVQSTTDVPLSNAKLQKGLLHEKEGQIAQLEIEACVLRERNHALFENNLDLSHTLGVKPVTMAEIDARQLDKKAKAEPVQGEVPVVDATVTSNAKEKDAPESASEKKSTPTVTKDTLNHAGTLFKTAKAAADTAKTAANVVDAASKFVGGKPS